MKTISPTLTGILSLLALSPAALAEPPLPPENVRPAWLSTPFPDSGPLVVWQPSVGAESYHLYRADDINATWTVVATNLATPFHLDSFFSFLPSYYVVVAVNADGESDVSAPVTVNEQYGGTISAWEVRPDWGTLTSTNARVQWSTSWLGGDEGIVEWGPVTGGETNYNSYLLNTNYLPAQQFLITNLLPLTEYTYRVTSISSTRGGVRWTGSFMTPDLNHPPVAGQSLLWNSYGTNLLFLLTLTDSDPPFCCPYPTNSARITAAPTNGALVYFSQLWWDPAQWYVTYVPDARARGEDRFSFVVNDGELDSAPVTIVVSNWMNTVPAGGWITLQGVEDTPLNFTLNDFDPDGDPVTFNFSWLQGGTVSGVPPNFTFTPNPNVTGQGWINYEITDGYGTNYGSLEIHLASVNDQPVADPLFANVYEDYWIYLYPWFLDLDGSGSYITEIETQPAHGTVTTFGFEMIYTPAPNFFGTDTFTFAVVELDGTRSEPAIATITVVPLNDYPVPQSQNLLIPENTSANVVLSATDPDGDILTYWVNSGPFHGTLTGTAPYLTYIPNSNFFGHDTLNFSVNDGHESRQGTVTVAVGANSLPQPLLRRRTFADGIVHLWWSGVTGAQYFNLYRADGSNAPFTLLASQVVATNFEDTAAQWQHPYWYYVRTWDGTNEGQPSNPIFAYPDSTGVLNLDQQNWLIRGNTGRVSFYSSIIGGTEGIFEYGTNRDYGVFLENTNILPFQVFNLSGLTPMTVYHFRITATDANGNAIVVSTNLFQDWFATESRPIAHAQSVAVTEDTPLNITLTGSDPNYIFHPITYHLVSGVAHGTLTAIGPNTYRYVPAANYNGPDAFAFKVNNGELDSFPATVGITVEPVNDAPLAFNQSRVLGEDTATNLTLQAADAEGGPVTFQILAAPAHGTLSGTLPFVTYLPATNYFGTDSFAYTVRDPQFASATGTVTLTITNINDRPVPTPQSVITAEDVPLLVNVSGTDVDGDPLTLLILALPVHGTLSALTPTNVLYTPAPNYNGPDNFTFRVSDGKLISQTSSSINITVTPGNDVPVANGQSVSTAEDTPQAITLTGTDANGDPLSFALLSGPGHGTLTGTPPNLTYVPLTNYYGADSFTFVVHDGMGSSAPATVGLDVISVNDPPVASARSAMLMEDFPTAVTLVANDLEGDLLTFSIVSAPAHGTLSGNGTTFTYAPAANYYGTDSFVYRATDPAGASSDAVFSLTITPANDRPVGVDQTVGVLEETPLWFVPDATDADGDVIGFVITQPMKGTAVVTNGGLLYSPNPNYFGNDILYYWPNDGSKTGALTVIVFNITNVNDAPTANDRTATTAEDVAVNITLTGSDPDNDPLSFAIVSGPSHGTLSGTGATRTYTPAANYNGSDSFSFVANDGTINSAAATVNITVTPVNDAPSIMSDSRVTDEDTPVSFTLNAADVENDPLAWIIVSNPFHGTLSGTAPVLTYTPDANYVGPDSFTYRVNDGTVNSGLAIANVTVRAVNDPPSAHAQTVAVNEDTAAAITLTGSDVDGDGLSYTVLSSPAHGTLSGTPINITSTNANFTYLPAANYNGADSFTFKVHDGRTNSLVATVTINVAAVNDAPVANPQSVTVTYNTAKAITLTGSDIEGSALTYSFPSLPTNGTLTGAGANMTYTPNVGSAGIDYFTFRAYDGNSFGAPAPVSITTQNPASAPAAPSGLAVTVPSTSGTLILAWNDNSPTEDGFKIERSPNGNNTWTQIAALGINLRNYTNSGLANKTMYYYRVRAYNVLGNSAYSNNANGKTR